MLENYLFSTDHNNINNYSIEHNMDFPTNDYYVYSSHNTYLKGHQLYGILLIKFRREFCRYVRIRYRNGL